MLKKIISNQHPEDESGTVVPTMFRFKNICGKIQEQSPKALRLSR